MSNSSPLRNSSSFRSSSPVRSSSPMHGSSPMNGSSAMRSPSPNRFLHGHDDPQPQSLSERRYQQVRTREQTGSRTTDARSIATEIPFDQAVDLSIGDTDSLEPGRIHSAALAARPPPSPSASRRSPTRQNPTIFTSNSNQSPSNSFHSANSGTSLPRFFADVQPPLNEIDKYGPASKTSSRHSPDVASGDSLLRKSRDFVPSISRNSPLTAVLAGHEELEEDRHRRSASNDPSLREHPSFQSNYKLAPPRVSVPMTLPYVDEDPSALTGELSFENARQSAVRVTPDVEDEDSLFDFEERNRKMKEQRQNLQQLPLSQQHTLPQRPQQYPKILDCNDSFSADEETDDDSEIVPPVSLQERSQAAWKRKQRLSQQQQQHAALAELADSVPASPAALRGQSRGEAQPTVSFGKDDVVHSYDPQNDTVDDATLAGRSLNSVYTKSAESEVEDIIKDIFMIGSGEGTNPGRRKVKYNPRIKARQEGLASKRTPESKEESFEDDDNTYDAKEEEDEDTYKDEDEEDDTYTGTFDETVEDTTAIFTETSDTKATTTDSIRASTQTTDSTYRNARGSAFEDAYTTNTDTNDETTGSGTNTELEESTITYTDGESTTESINRWTSPFHVPSPSQKTPPSTSEDPKAKKSVTFNDEKKVDDPLADAWNFWETGVSAVGAALGLDQVVKAQQSPRSAPLILPKPRYTGKADYTDEESATAGSDTTGSTGGGWNFLDFASNLLLGPVKCQPSKQESIQSARSLEEDSRLIDLAIQAAVSVHRLNGYEFDLSREVDIHNEIKFSVVDLVLPLGIIFQENEKGCFVTKILPEGSAARTNGDIQIGDQLAAVDGASAIDMTVDEIASMVRVKKQVIELTFLRYVGPLRPVVGTVIQEEGYEIRASENRGKLLARQTSVAATVPVAAFSPIAPIRSDKKPKGILKNRITPPPMESPRMREKEKISEPPVLSPPLAPAPAPAPAPTPSTTPILKEKKRFRLFGRFKKQK